MTARMTALGALLAIGVGGAEIHASEEVCPSETLFNPYSAICAPINDVRNLLVESQTLSLSTPKIPNLIDLRRQLAVESRSSNFDVPPPGGIGAGTTYKTGSLQTLEHGELHTKMFVHPFGIEPSNLELDWLFTTATNRTEKTVEVVGIYFRDSPGVLGVFDWSCSAESPCAGGLATPDWVSLSEFTNFSCNMNDIDDGGGHTQIIMQYANQSMKLDNGNPALWENSVYLWNFCSDEWDLVYQHPFQANQVDCSLSSACGWWGPILETFLSDPSDRFPRIREVGFKDSLLLHDTTWSSLPPSETEFSNPVSPWVLFHLDANQSYGAGNYVVTADPQGCAIGYWKNHLSSWGSAGLDPSQAVQGVFSEASRYPMLGDQTLLDALRFHGSAGTGGGAAILLRQAVASLLNASHPDVTYPRSANDMIDDVDEALAAAVRETMLTLATALESDNRIGCRLR